MKLIQLSGYYENILSIYLMLIWLEEIAYTCTIDGSRFRMTEDKIIWDNIDNTR